MLDIKRLLESKKLLVIGVVVYTILITFIFLMPTNDLPRVKFPGGVDKSVHFLIHLVLVLLWQLFWFRRNNYRLSLFNSFIIVAGSLGYGIIIEFMQGYLTTSRTPDFLDVLANFSGALIGVLLFQKIKYLIAP